MSSSKFFQRFDPSHPDNAEFVHYARQLRDLRDEDIDAIMAALDKFIGGTEKMQAESASSLAQALKRPLALSASLLRALEEFLRHFASGADETEARAVAADLQAADIIESADEAAIATLMIRLASIAPSTLLQIEMSDAKNGYLSIFQDMQTTVELRAVFTNKQSTEPAGHVAIASIYIEIDREPDALFQIDRASLDAVIGKLQLTSERLRRCEELAKSLNSGVTDVAKIA
jgi:hypothetical protein